MKHERCIAGVKRWKIKDIYQDIYSRLMKYICHTIFFIMLVIEAFLIFIVGYFVFSLFLDYDPLKIGSMAISIFPAGIIAIIIGYFINKRQNFKEKHYNHIKYDISNNVEKYFKNIKNNKTPWKNSELSIEDESWLLLINHLKTSSLIKFKKLNNDIQSLINSKNSYDKYMGVFHNRFVKEVNIKLMDKYKSNEFTSNYRPYHSDILLMDQDIIREMDKNFIDKKEITDSLWDIIMDKLNKGYINPTIEELREGKEVIYLLIRHPSIKPNQTGGGSSGNVLRIKYSNEKDTIIIKRDFNLIINHIIEDKYTNQLKKINNDRELMLNLNKQIIDDYGIIEVELIEGDIPGYCKRCPHGIIKKC